MTDIIEQALEEAAKVCEKNRDDPEMTSYGDFFADKIRAAISAIRGKVKVEVEMDEDGENQAVRAFLLGYSGGGITIKAMRNHLRMSGHDNHWPAWAETSDRHLTKLGAQNWLRYLFSLETPPTEAQVKVEPVAWIDEFDEIIRTLPIPVAGITGTKFIPLYTAPPTEAQVKVEVEPVKIQSIHMLTKEGFSVPLEIMGISPAAMGLQIDVAEYAKTTEAQVKVEPVAWRRMYTKYPLTGSCTFGQKAYMFLPTEPNGREGWEPLYTSPPTEAAIRKDEREKALRLAMDTVSHAGYKGAAAELLALIDKEES